MVSDVFPKKASVTGIRGIVGPAAGIVTDRTMGTLLTNSGPSGCFFAFIAAGLVYLLALGVAHLLLPRMARSTRTSGT